jgi:hypothetical protein
MRVHIFTKLKKYLFFLQVDRLGRRTLLIGGFVGTLVCTALIAISMLVVKVNLNCMLY